MLIASSNQSQEKLQSRRWVPLISMCEGRGQHTEAGWELCGSHGPLQGSPFRLQAGGGGFVEAPGPQLVAPEWAAVCPEGPKAAQGEPGPGSGLGPGLGQIQLHEVQAEALEQPRIHYSG